VVRPQDNLRAVFSRMRSTGVSQLPVIEDGRVVGLIDESDVLAALITDPDGPNKAFELPVKDVMQTRLETIRPMRRSPIWLPLFRKDFTAIVMDSGQFPRRGDAARPHQLFPDHHLMTSNRNLDFATRCVHAGQEPDPTTGAVMMPIYATLDLRAAEPGREQRATTTPAPRTRPAWPSSAASPISKAGQAAFAFASGLSAIAKPRSIASSTARTSSRSTILYGGSRRLFEARAQALGRHRDELSRPHRCRSARGCDQAEHQARLDRDADQPDAQAGRSRTHRCDRQEARRVGPAPTTPSPVPMCKRPLEHGFDLVVHSTTKYLNGHSDMVGGVAVVGGNDELRERLTFLQNAVGAIQGPFDSFLALRGLKTLALRMERHCTSAFKIAQWLERHPKVRRVYYPGPSEPSPACARQEADARVRRHDLAGRPHRHARRRQAFP